MFKLNMFSPQNQFSDHEQLINDRMKNIDQFEIQISEEYIFLYDLTKI